MDSSRTRALPLASSWLLIGCIVTQASGASTDRDAPLPLPHCGDGVQTVHLKSRSYKQQSNLSYHGDQCTFVGEPGATIVGGLRHLPQVALRGSIHFEGGEFYSGQITTAHSGNFTFANVSFDPDGGLLFYNSSVLFDRCSVQVGDNHMFYAESSRVMFRSSLLTSLYVGEIGLRDSIVRFLNTSVTTFNSIELNRSNASFEGPDSRVVGKIHCCYKLEVRLYESALTFEHGDAAIAPVTGPYDPLAPDRVSVQTRSLLNFARCTSLGRAMPNVSFSVSGDSEVNCSPGRSPSRIQAYVAPAAMYV